jgi:hypothetical protein
VEGEVAIVSTNEWWWELECRQSRSAKQEFIKTGQTLEDGRREEDRYADKNKEGKAKKKLQEHERVKGGTLRGEEGEDEKMETEEA